MTQDTNQQQKFIVNSQALADAFANLQDAIEKMQKEISKDAELAKSQGKKSIAQLLFITTYCNGIEDGVVKQIGARGMAGNGAIIRQAVEDAVMEQDDFRQVLAQSFLPMIFGGMMGIDEEESEEVNSES